MRGFRPILGGVIALAVQFGGFGTGEREALARHACVDERAPGKRNQDGTWRTVRASGVTPSGRSAPAVAAQGRWIYVFGGSHDDVVTGEVTLYGDFHRFDTLRNRWQSVSVSGAQPPARAFAPLVNDPASERLVMYGGATFGDFFGDFVALEDLWAFDPDRGTWTELGADNVGPGGRSGATLWIDGGKLYLFGGIDSFFQTYNDLWTYEFATHIWLEVIPNGASTSPPARHEALSGSAVHDGRVTLYGGETVTEDFSFITLPDTWQYDLAQGTWQELTPAPQHDITPPRNLGAAALLGDALYVHGGDIPGGELCGAVFAQNPTDELWRFDLKAGRWKKLSPRGTTVARLKRSRGVEVGGAMYILGGYDFTCTAGVATQLWNDDVFLYEPSRSGPRH